MGRAALQLCRELPVRGGGRHGLAEARLVTMYHNTEYFIVSCTAQPLLFIQVKARLGTLFSLQRPSFTATANIGRDSASKVGMHLHSNASSIFYRKLPLSSSSGLLD